MRPDYLILPVPIGSSTLSLISGATNGETGEEEEEHTPTATPSTHRRRRTSHVELGEGEDGGIVMDICEGACPTSLLLHETLLIAKGNRHTFNID